MARYNINEAMKVQANVNNLFDEKYYNYMTAGSSNLYRYGAPRSVSVSFSYNF